MKSVDEIFKSDIGSAIDSDEEVSGRIIVSNSLSYQVPSIDKQDTPILVIVPDLPDHFASKLPIMGGSMVSFIGETKDQPN